MIRRSRSHRLSIAVLLAVAAISAPVVAAEVAEPGDLVLERIVVNPENVNLRPVMTPQSDVRSWRIEISMAADSASFRDVQVLTNGAVNVDYTGWFSLTGAPPVVIRPGDAFDLEITGEISGEQISFGKSDFSFTDLRAFAPESRGNDLFLGGRELRGSARIRIRRTREDLPGLTIFWNIKGHPLVSGLPVVAFEYVRADERRTVEAPIPGPASPRAQPPRFTPQNCRPVRGEYRCQPRRTGPRDDAAGWNERRSRANGCPCLRDPTSYGVGDQECARRAGDRRGNSGCR